MSCLIEVSLVLSENSRVNSPHPCANARVEIETGLQCVVKRKNRSVQLELFKL
jgi:hypothetical protein